MDASGADQRLPHRAAECKDVSLEELAELGVKHWAVSGFLIWCTCTVLILDECRTLWGEPEREQLSNVHGAVA